MKWLRGALALILFALPRAGWAAGYDSLVEQGGFYLERGATYGADAVRVLEKAEQENPERAGSDPKLLFALARAYALTARFTEAYWALGRWERLGSLHAEGEALRGRLLSETGLGRLRLASAVPQGRVVCRVAPSEGARIDVAARKALDRLTELLSRGLEVGSDGVVLLVPEGTYALACEGPSLFAPREPVPAEVWAGDEAEVRLVAAYPEAGRWGISAGNRIVSLTWPATPGAVYELTREGDEQRTKVYRGAEAAYQDEGLPVGAKVRYVLKTYGPQGDLVAVSSAQAETMPPVSSLAAEADLDGDLRVRIAWRLGEGAADRVRVVRGGGARSEEVVADVRERAAIAAGAVHDGPFVPGAERVELSYRVEAWVAAAEEPSAATTVQGEIPPRVERITSVVQGVERGAVLLQWDTLPRDGIAQGYAVFRQRGSAVAGELVGKVEDPFAREFEYAVEDPLKASEWNHVVVPYVGDQYVLDPELLTFDGRVPEQPMERRAAQVYRPPNLALAWDAYPGAAGYAVKVGERKEVFVKRPYLEISGLQSALMGTAHEVKVFALGVDGRKSGLVTIQIQYEHYPRVVPKEEEP